MPIHKEKIKPVSIVPNFLERDYSSHIKDYSDTELQISKGRETGIAVEIGRQRFNIDVDFLWSAFPQFLPDKEKVVIASNRNVFKTFRINYLNDILGGKKISFVANPYIGKSEGFDEKAAFNEIDEANYKKLFLLYNMKWHNKESNWEKSVFEYFQNMHPRKRNTFYKNISDVEFSSALSTTEKLERFNLPKSIQEVNDKIKRANELRAKGLIQ